ncbi:MAG: enoyl-CoA hydratase/isomerase family protein, partial [Acidimicrobiales bacterium]|nr:enoyl-CoA hydratase/isomerase family protein [Acidimicrobiales bacterium]
MSSSTLDTGTEKMLAHVEDGVGFMVYNNPARRNAQSMEMVQALPKILASFQDDPEVAVVVVTGAGDKAFVSGADISEFGERRTTPEA